MKQSIDQGPSVRLTISIVSPCYNEEDNVRNCYEVVRALFEQHLSAYEREHIFTDNASTDSTVGVLREIASQDPAVKVIVNSRNFGLFRSTFNALRYATGDATLVMLPVDLQDPPELLPEFVRLWKEGHEVVAGVRTGRRESIFMRGARRTFYRIVNRLSGFEIPEDVGCGFRRTLVPYEWKRRRRGSSKIGMLELVDQALNGIFSFTNAPMRACTFLGVALAALCFLYAVITLVVYLVTPNVAPRGTISLVVGLFFLVGIQLIFIGLLGEYVTAIHAQVRRGPTVIERERINLPESPASSRK
jgi:glycosyltransferase involved in cell wall biosynthesis